jgi:hypothetical protein
MKKYSRIINSLIVLIILVVGVGTSAQQVQAQIKHEDIPDDAPFVPGELVVGLATTEMSIMTERAAALAGDMNAQVVRQDGNIALLSFNEDADVEALSAQLSGAAGVAYAEPNYVYSIPEMDQSIPRPTEPTTVTRTMGDGSTNDVSVEELRAMRTIKGNKIMATYPNDPSLLGWGWTYISADIVSTNTSASKGICELDTGVDYSHPDLTGHIIKGTDFVNNDADPMDDNGHGTHVAGIMTAVSNNAIGLAGVAFNGKVVAVKVLNAQGWGTNYGVSLGINYCANRTDVNILNMSLGGPSSTSIYNAVDYAVNTKGKLLVAAAGNENTSTRSYPAGWSTTFPDKVLAVAAIDNGSTTSLGCRASYSNYGNWISVVAPGTSIYSTLPYNKPFYLNYMYGYYGNYDYLSGTSMATPYVSAVAARDWGYQVVAHPGTWTNASIGNSIKNGSYSTVLADDVCWPATMSGIRMLNVAYLLERGAASGYIRDANAGIPLPGATMNVYKSNVLVGSGLTPTTNIGSSYVEVINLPAGSNYTAKVNKTGYTNGVQPAFQHTSNDYYTSGYHNNVYASKWMFFGATYIPPKTANIGIVAGWANNYYAYTGADLDLDVWLPNVPNALDLGQPAKFCVGDGDSAYDYGMLEGDPTGTLFAFPFAIYNREGGSYDSLSVESATISNRKAHAPLAANVALPYYASSASNPYWVELYDHGIMYDGSHTMIYQTYPWAYVWKDGVIKGFAEDTEGCNQHAWWPFRIYGGTSGTMTVDAVEGCGSGYYPYSEPGFNPPPVSGQSR